MNVVAGRFVVGGEGLEAAEFGDGAELEALILGAGAVDGSLEFFEGGEVGFVLFEEIEEAVFGLVDAAEAEEGAGDLFGEALLERAFRGGFVEDLGAELRVFGGLSDFGGVGLGEEAVGGGVAGGFGFTGGGYGAGGELGVGGVGEDLGGGGHGVDSFG